MNLTAPKIQRFRSKEFYQECGNTQNDRQDQPAGTLSEWSCAAGQGLGFHVEQTVEKREKHADHDQIGANISSQYQREQKDLIAYFIQIVIQKKSAFGDLISGPC